MARSPVRQILPTQIAGPDEALEKLLMADLNMLAVTGGRERSEGEWQTLLASSGFDLRRIVPVGATASILEAVGIRR